LTTVETREIRLLPHQHELIADTQHRVLGLVSGYGGGKTFAVARKACTLALLNPGADGIITEPNHPLLTQILIPEMIDALEAFGIPYKYNRAESIFYCRVEGRQTRIVCKSMENYDRLIGINAAWVIMDEFDTAKTELAYSAFQRLMGRLRAGNVRQMVIVSTPEGFKAMHRIFVVEAREGRRLIKAKTADNRHLPDDYIPSLIEAYPAQLIEAYLNGEFVNLTSGTVYSSYNRARCESHETIRDGEQILIGMDFNIGNMAACIGVKRVDGLHFVEEISGVLDTPEMIRTIISRYEGHAIRVYPDASGGGRKTVDASKSDLILLKQARFRVVVNPANPAVRDRIVAMNSGFESARVWVNSRACPTLAASLEQQAYNPQGEPDKQGGFDHQVDAAGYLVVKEMPVRKPSRDAATVQPPPAPRDYRPQKPDEGEQGWMI